LQNILRAPDCFILAVHAYKVFILFIIKSMGFGIITGHFPSLDENEITGPLIAADDGDPIICPTG
jgi:hypothetical protein